MFSIRQCPACHFRFPTPADTRLDLPCPRCHTATQQVVPAYTSPKVDPSLQSGLGVPVEALLDSLRSAWNVGSIFRTADGAGLRHLHLCGTTPTPENPKTLKTALGSESAVPWTYHLNGLLAVRELKAQGMRILGLEGGSSAVSIFEAVHQPDARPILLVVGSELSGIDPDILCECDTVVAIPMLGFKRSLNVATAFGVAAYTLRFGKKAILS